MITAVTFELSGDLLKPGFKPLMWRLASSAGLGGWVTESEKGDSIVLKLEGEEDKIQTFIRPIPGLLMPKYRLDNIRVLSKHDRRDGDTEIGSFKVITAPDFVLPDVQPDRAPCPDCLREVLDPNSKRYCYPFSSCTKCGMGYSVQMYSPFRRGNTFFASFPTCQDCRTESHDPENRHYHGSELLTCPTCGPHLFLLDSDGEFTDDCDCIRNARSDLKRGKVLALQSLTGGFHLFVDASNPDAIRELRRRKKLPSRPIAVMARNIDAVKKICKCSPEEEELLLSPAAPMVIMKIREDAKALLPCDLLCPDGPRMGVSLPPSILMRLLFEHVQEKNSAEQDPEPFDFLASISSTWNGRTSGNGVDEMLLSLRGVADVFLCHDLRINSDNPTSVAVVRDGKPQIWRRSRGYAPMPVLLKRPLRRNAVAFGTDVNGSVALASGNRIIPSQHLGDILNAEASSRLSGLLEHFTDLFDTVPDVVACDMNPHLRSTEAAVRFSQRYSLPLITVQTHHAIALAGMAENGLEHALACVLDNGEPGPDGFYWGAELLDTEIHSFRRLGTFQPVGMPGCEIALNRPVRQLVGRMIQAGVEFTPSLLNTLRISEEELAIWQKNFKGQGRFLRTHAAARLFDAVSAGLGVAPDFTGYRGQSAARLEYAAMRAPGGIQSIPMWMYEKFGFNTFVDDTPKMMVDWSPLFRNFADPSWITPENIPYLALAFHVKIADSIAALTHYGAEQTGVRDVILSGAMFMNGILLDLVLGKLRSLGFNVYIHHSVPMDGSGLAVGQAWNAAW